MGYQQPKHPKQSLYPLLFITLVLIVGTILIEHAAY